ncbi:LysR family transcriptional regulator [Solihabitans fulvus]|uniref:LysR family transcriptional regulator n=1 Tax=Solihabitans fulvus TaxID=1892852 RepID=A0A5B2WL67_9PSEU|nr:LysR family transcriptional regulator [Solihabitans fulvus]
MLDLPGVELRHLRYFATVAEAGTITEAARRLRIAQPSLSQQIIGLERRVGRKLFQRRTNGMELTESGRTLLNGVRRAFAELDTAVAAIRTTPLPVRVGLGLGVPTELIGRIEDALVAACQPDPLRLTFEPVDSQRQPALLRTGELTLGVLRPPVADGEDLRTAIVSDEPLGVVLHRDHPLAARSTLALTDLADQLLLWFPESRAPGFAAETLAHLAAHGWRPTLQPSDHTSHTLFAHALRGRSDLVALRPRTAVGADPALTWLPIADAPPRERLALAALADGPWSRLLTDVADAVRNRLPSHSGRP